MELKRRYYDEVQFRVWPDSTVQCVDDEPEPHPWMPDDFTVVWACSEDAAVARAQSTPQPADPSAPTP